MGSHIPALDGIRGLAILLVLFYHQTLLNDTNVTATIDLGFIRVANAGWCGVDLFFVLSGFLITGILFDARNGRHYFRNFYMRRTLRIFPLYYAVVFLCLVVMPNLPEGVVPLQKAENFARIEGDEIWYWLYLSNFAIASAEAFRHAILDISWSLAIEEQFYVVWPAVVLALGRLALMRLCVVMVVVALALRTALTLGGTDWHVTYVITPARMDLLAIGAFIALAARGPRGVAGLLPSARIAFRAGMALLLATFLWRGELSTEDPVMLTVGFTVIGVAFGGLLVMAIMASPGSGLARFFTSGFMRSFGKYSYAMYLFHMPLRALLRDTAFGVEQFPVLLGSAIPGQLMFYVLATAVAYVAALVSWNLFEKRLLALKRFFPTERGPRSQPAPATG